MALVSFGINPIGLADFLGRIEKEAQTGLQPELPADAVFLSIANDQYHLGNPPSDQFVAMFPTNMPPWQSVVSGAGSSYSLAPSEENLGFDLSMRMAAFCRLSTDQEFRSSQLIRNLALGIMVVANKLIRVFQIWTAPLDDDATASYLREPARITSGPRMGHRNFEKSLWSVVEMQFEFRFTLAL